MTIAKLSIKLYATSAPVDAEAAIPIFHEWIREDRLPGELPIDVTDYTHVPSGPGVLLVGHGADYAVDEGEGRPGILFRRKRAFDGPLSERIADAIERARRAARMLEADERMGGARFDDAEARLVLLDRLRAPNTDDALEALRPEIEAGLAAAYEGREVTIEREGDRRRPFTLRVRAS